jgi:hypothetical protein
MEGTRTPQRPSRTRPNVCALRSERPDARYGPQARSEFHGRWSAPPDPPASLIRRASCCRRCKSRIARSAGLGTHHEERGSLRRSWRPAGRAYQGAAPEPEESCIRKMQDSSWVARRRVAHARIREEAGPSDRSLTARDGRRRGRSRSGPNTRCRTSPGQRAALPSTRYSDRVGTWSALVLDREFCPSTACSSGRRWSGSWAFVWSAWTSRVGLEEPGLVGKPDCLDTVAEVELFDGPANTTRVVALGRRFRRPPIECAVFRDLGAPLVAYAVVPRRYLLFVRRGLRCWVARCRVGMWRHVALRSSRRTLDGGG